MPVAKPISNLEQDLTNKMQSLGARLQQRSVGHFTICNPWLTPLRSMFSMAMSLVCFRIFIGTPSPIPWDDSTFGQKLGMLPSDFAVLGFIGVPGMFLFIFSFATWSDPYKLLFDGTGSLILRSVACDQRIAIENIRTISLDQQKNGEESTDKLGIRTEFSDGKLKLPLFAEREEFLKLLKAEQPAIVIETV